MLYKREILEESIHNALRNPSHNIIALLGARQTGKTTLAREVAKNFSEDFVYLTLDKKDLRDYANENPSGFLEAYPNALVIIDEIQKAPALIEELKSVIDNQRYENAHNEEYTKTKFLVTGSADIYKIISESNAGRTKRIIVPPLSQREIEGLDTNFLDDLFSGEWKHKQLVTSSKENLCTRIFTGGMPEIMPHNSHMKTSWRKDYMEALLTKDIKDLPLKVRSFGSLTKFTQWLAGVSAQEFVTSNASAELSIDKKTIDKYVELLNQLFLTYSLQGWNQNTTKRAVSRPKMFYADSGLLCYMQNLTETTLLANPKILGHIAESFVVGEILKDLPLAQDTYEVYHYRTAKEHNSVDEVDILLRNSEGKFIGIEIKTRKSPQNSDFKYLHRLRKELQDDLLLGLVLFSGEPTEPAQIRSYNAAYNFYAAPISLLWS